MKKVSSLQVLTGSSASQLVTRRRPDDVRSSRPASAPASGCNAHVLTRVVPGSAGGTAPTIGATIHQPNSPPAVLAPAVTVRKTNHMGHAVGEAEASRCRYPLEAFGLSPSEA